MSVHRGKTVFLAALCACVLFVSSAAASEANLRRDLDAALDSAVRDNRIVGGVLLVARDGETVYSRAVGLADREEEKAAELDSLFRLSSVSKVYTAMAAAALVDQGKLRLDDPVSKYLPYFTPALPDGKTPDITVKHLLTFTAGLNYVFAEEEGGPYHRAGVSDGLDGSLVTLEENIRRIASAPLLFEPGSAFNYSLALDVLGGVIAAAHGTELPQAMYDLVWGPLGLRDTAFTAVDPDRLTVPYYNADPLPKRMEEDEPVSFGPMRILFAPSRATNPYAYPSGGAGMVGTAADLLVLLETMRQGGAPLVKPDLMRQIGQNQVGDLRMMPGVAFGLGVGVTADQDSTAAPEPDGTVFWSGVYGNYWLMDPANGVSLALFTNTAFEGMAGKLVDDVRAAVYGNL